ncbi:MAG: hypothetical protein DME19_09095 [Verrucomicrobia bacterium]|nr:MAG: hypothetical protein DME19_09095 [Verrucomicrobiota bacterium]
MRFFVFNSSGSGPATRVRAGFTLPEIMVAMALFSLVVIGAVYTHLFGMRLYRITESKLSSTDNARSAVNRVSDEIRAAKMVEIGNGNSASFSVIADNLPQIGNALQVYASTNTNSFVRYFMDPKESALKSMPSGSSAATVVASFVTNALVFRAEDFLGNVLTNNQDNRVIKMTLEFYQLQYPIVRIGPGYLYDYYITRRAIE